MLYGNTGTAAQPGALGPDKIVFRDGWDPENSYLNLNLRFSGWHRYKATNSVITLYKNGQVIIEKKEDSPTSWLPIGRSVFRDKRIPRENLNGFMIPKVGLNKFIYWITGVGSEWAQDVPIFAHVDEFITGQEYDYSKTSIVWNRWTQTREIYFYHDGVIIISDSADGPIDERGSIIWHGTLPLDQKEVGSDVIRLGADGQIGMRIVPVEPGVISCQKEDFNAEKFIECLFTADQKGSLHLVTIFLDENYQDSMIRVSKQEIVIENSKSIIHLPNKK